ncbi:hypothetical protein B0T20DRAFT_505674 [Sordaria brevicollis]|uniref:Uncharacterized protein n=1 Tax=Sordaria brevicollis TaxID=83679 RepID=A0AAE0PGW7_SORBR|nr:hypothetical protein B0T20DRAFT_505674 [Sordaria brevicollis]
MWIENHSNTENCYTFRASGCFDDDVLDDDIYDGVQPHTGREEFALKYAFYILANAPGSVLDQYPLMGTIRTRQASNLENFHRRLEVAIVSMLRFIRVKAEEVIQAQGNTRGWVINKVTATIPSQWTLRYEDLYRKFLAQALDWTAQVAQDQIKFYYEIEGLASFLLLDMQGQLVKNGKVTHQLCLLLDFGGHSMNGRLYWATSEDGKIKSFFATDEAFEAGGGGEHFIDRLLETCVRKVEEESNGAFSVTPRGKQTAEDAFRKNRAVMGPGGSMNQLDLVLEVGPNRALADCRLTEEDINMAWHKAFGPAIELATTHIQSLAVRDEVQTMNTTALVVLSGGSLKNTPLASTMNAAVEEAGLGDPQQAYLKGGDSQSVRLCAGVAHSEKTQIDVTTFFNRGVGIGVQIQPEGGGGLWENVAYCPLYHDTNLQEDVHPECTIDLQRKDRIRLICDPNFGKNTLEPGQLIDPVDDLVKIDWKRTYTFLEKLPHHSALKNRCDIFLKRGKEGDNDVLRLKMKMVPIMRSKLEKMRRTENFTINLPLYYDPGTRCVMPGQKTMSLRQAIPRLFERQEGEQNEDGEEEEEDDVDEDGESTMAG